MFASALSYLAARFAEKSSWTGIGLIVVGTLALLYPSLITWAAIGAIAYGIWAFFTKG